MDKVIDEQTNTVVSTMDMGNTRAIRRIIIMHLNPVAVYGLIGIETNELMRAELLQNATSLKYCLVIIKNFREHIFCFVVVFPP